MNEINMYKEYSKFQEMNGKVLINSLIEERSKTKMIIDKLNASQNQCVLANSAFEETRQNMNIYKVVYEELEKKEKYRGKLQGTKNEGATGNITEEKDKNVIILIEVIEDLKKDMEKEKIETKRLKSDLDNS